jgi:hypothetical protein
MLRIRIVSVSVLAAIAVALTVNAAAAQTSDTAGQPLTLLAGLHPPHTAKAHAAPAHRKIAKLERKRVARHGPAVAMAEPVAPPAPAGLPDNGWPTPPQPAPDNTVAAAPAVQLATPAANDATPGAIVMNGQTVEIASPDDLNAIDRAAEDSRDAPAALPADHADSATPVQTVLAAPVHDDASAVGGTPWIAQVLAALGGAVAAGVTAWFMIGPGPQRMYG